MKRYAIIVAGGSGSRFGSAVPKQFLPMNGKPVLMHTIEHFAALSNIEIIVVLPSAQQEWWNELCAEHGFTVAHSVVIGGDSRFQSVKNALVTITPAADDLVAVHDGVRPLVSRNLIEATYAAAAQSGAAIPATPVTDSIRQIVSSDGESKAVERSSLRAVQTPQAFNAKALIEAYDVPFSSLFTDDASVMESAGHKVTLVEGEVGNIKITHPLDIEIAQLMMRQH